MFELHKDEKVILYIRRHWVFLLREIILIFLLFISPTFVVWLAQYFSYVPDVNLFGVSIYSLTDVFIYLWALFCWMLLAEKFTDYCLDFWVVTNKRIIESELIKLFDVQLSTLELQDIEDITVHSEGFWASIIGYGKLEIQTAGAKNEFFAEKIMNPAQVQKIIFDAKLSQKKEEMDIEKGEFEQISERVVGENLKKIYNENLDSQETFANLKMMSPAYSSSNISESRKVEEENQNMKDTNFDWAHVEDRQKQDKRNVEEYIEEIDSKYKAGIDKALRSE